jgi:hypothetical protein
MAQSLCRHPFDDWFGPGDYRFHLDWLFELSSFDSHIDLDSFPTMDFGFSSLGSDLDTTNSKRMMSPYLLRVLAQRCSHQ